AVAAPFDHHRTAVELALDFCWHTLALDCRHLLFRLAETLLKWAVKAFQGLNPILASFFDLVELLLHRGGKADLENIRKACKQKLAHHPAERGGAQPLALIFIDIIAIQDTGHDRSIG